MKPKYFVAAVVLAAGTAAQIDYSTVDPCILSCIATGLTVSGCSDISDLSCICRSGSFFDSSQSCLLLQCTDKITAGNATLGSICNVNSPPSSSNSASGTSARVVTSVGIDPGPPNTEGGALLTATLVDNSKGSSTTKATGASASGAKTSPIGVSSSEADSKSSSKTNVGAIVGGVVGGVLGAGLLAGLLFVLCRRRKNQSDQIEEPFVVDATEDVVTPYKMEVGESTLSNKGYASVVTYEPQDPPGDEPSSTTYPTSSQDSSTMKQEVRTQQNIVTIDPNEPMHEDTARALLAAIHRQHSTVGVNQEQDAGPVGTAIPPSYNPGWAQRQSESSGLGVASPSSGMSDSASPPKPLSKS